MCIMRSVLTAAVLLAWSRVSPVPAQSPQDYLKSLERQYPNLVYNPGMETPGWFRAESPEYWQDRPNARRDTKVFRTGAASLRIEGPASGYTFQIGGTALVPGTAYRLTCWVKAKDLKGKGVGAEYSPVARPTARVLSRGGATWTEIELRFTTPAKPGPGQLRIVWDLVEGDVVWVDDVRLEPVDAAVPTAPKPRVTPDGGVHRGAVAVTLETDLAHSQIRYTTDGSEPHALSTLYRGPLLLMDRVTLKARVFHPGHREGRAAEARFDLQRVADRGVPLEPIDWAVDVDRWWATHVYNPKSPQAWNGAVASPEPRLNVAEIRDKHPRSTTAGIAEALAMLPESGGTLWFLKDRGPYVVTEPEKKVLSYYFSQGAILVHRRSNLHFLSDGATIRCPWPVLGFSSMEIADKGTFNQPSRNFYFKGLTFDGEGKSDIGLNFIHCADVLFEDCTMANYVSRRVPAPGQVAPPQSWAAHPACIVATAMTDNIWLRRCTFSGSMWGVYWDGVHNGGFVDCRFPGPYHSGPILIMTNNDMACFSPTQRNAQYVVIAGCEFRMGRAAATLSNSNTLMVGNRVQGTGALMDMQGRGRSSVERGVAYEFYGNRLLDNALADVKVLSAWNFPCPSFGDRPVNRIAGNRATGLETILATDARGSFPVENIVVEGNELAGKATPQVVVRRESRDLVRRIAVKNNRLGGEPRDLVVDYQKKPIEVPGITLDGNRVAR